MPNYETLRQDIRSAIIWRWPLSGGIGAGMGAFAAVLFFPDAAFGRNPTGQFGWHLVWFAFLVGIFFALGQWLVLRKLSDRYLETGSLVTLLWLPASTAAIMAMLMPLWWVPGAALIWAPWLLPIYMFPGIIALALLQSSIMYLLTGTGFAFFLRTLLGTTIGILIGFIWPFVLPIYAIAPILVEHLPFEASWAFVTGATIGAFQVGDISKCFIAAVERRET